MNPSLRHPDKTAGGPRLAERSHGPFLVLPSLHQYLPHPLPQATQQGALMGRPSVQRSARNGGWAEQTQMKEADPRGTFLLELNSNKEISNYSRN